jgi:hypothetical protein
MDVGLSERPDVDGSFSHELLCEALIQAFEAAVDAADVRGKRGGRRRGR